MLDVFIECDLSEVYYLMFLSVLKNTLFEYYFCQIDTRSNNVYNVLYRTFH